LIGGICHIAIEVNFRVDNILENLYGDFHCNETMTRVTSRVFEAYTGRIGRIAVEDRTPGGHINFDDFRGDFVCLDKRPCDISKDWCGWRNVHGWKRITYKELEQANQEFPDEDDDHNGDNSDDRFIGIHDPDNYEILLPHDDLGDVSFSDISPLHHGFTLCFWLKTAHTGFFIAYKVTSQQSETLVLGFSFVNNTFQIHLDKTTSQIPMTVMDDTWHHVCVTWEAFEGLLDVYKDGERKYQSEGYLSSARYGRIEGGGTMTIGFNPQTKTPHLSWVNWVDSISGVTR